MLEVESKKKPVVELAFLLISDFISKLEMRGTLAPDSTAVDKER